MKFLYFLMFFDVLRYDTYILLISNR